MASSSPSDQHRQLFSLPLEVRRIIWAEAFFAMIGTQTLRPQRILPENDDQITDGTAIDSSKADTTAILATCHHLNSEVTSTWHRLPQHYESVRHFDLVSNCHGFGEPHLHIHSLFSNIAPPIWQQLTDLTITVAAFYRHSYGKHGTNPSARCPTTDGREVFQFAQTLRSSAQLKRLHIQPKIVERDIAEDYYECGRLQKRKNVKIMKEMWIYLKPFAYLSASVGVTVAADWEGYRPEYWRNAVTKRNCWREYAPLFDRGFAEMRRRFAGGECLYRTEDDTWEVPGVLDEYGVPVTV